MSLPQQSGSDDDSSGPDMMSEEELRMTDDKWPSSGSESGDSQEMDSDKDTSSASDELQPPKDDKTKTEGEDEEEDDDDEVVKAIRAAKEKKPLNHPPDLKLSSMPSDFCFHPHGDMIVVATLDFHINLYEYGNEENKLLHSVKPEQIGQCLRELDFSPDGKKLFGVCPSFDLVEFDVEGLRKERIYSAIGDPDKSSPYSMLVIDENIVAIGDEDGGVALWDRRKKTQAAALNVADGIITDMVCDENKQTLVCSSDDGTITSVKIRGNRIGTKSELYKEPFNCMGTFRQDTKLGVGDGKGDVYFFNWGEFGYHVDVFPARSGPINAMIPITEKIGIFAGEDGCLRAIHFYPHKNLGIVGRHPFAVEAMDVCNDGHLIASSSHDETIKFWNVDYFNGFTLPPDTEKKSAKTKENLKKHNLPSSNQGNKSDFYKGLMD